MFILQMLTNPIHISDHNDRQTYAGRVGVLRQQMAVGKTG